MRNMKKIKIPEEIPEQQNTGKTKIKSNVLNSNTLSIGAFVQITISTLSLRPWLSAGNNSVHLFWVGN